LTLFVDFTVYPDDWHDPTDSASLTAVSRATDDCRINVATGMAVGFSGNLEKKHR
jgi:hypothetical protein